MVNSSNSNPIKLYTSSEKKQTKTLEQLQMRLTPNTFGQMGHSLANSNRKRQIKSKQTMSLESTESPYVNHGEPNSSHKTPVK